MTGTSGSSARRQRGLGLSLVLSLAKLVVGATLSIALTLVVLVALALTIPAFFLYVGWILITTTITSLLRSSRRSGESPKTSCLTSPQSTTNDGSNTEMDSPFENYELVGGPWDGQVFRCLEDILPPELNVPLSEPGEFQRVGRYRFDGTDFVFDGEFVVHDVSQITDY